jgi:hypothetical protein
MSSPSNLYAEKIYAEHPIALWPLDDKADYISLIDESDRDVSNWKDASGDPLGIFAVTFTDINDEPFPESQTTKVTGALTDEDFGQIVCISNNLVNFSTLNRALSTFSIGGFFNSLSAYASSFEIGYEYYDTTSGSTIQRLKSYTTSVQNTWFFLSETFEIPEDNTEFRIVIKINYIGGASTIDDYEFLINGITVGQWCEEFNSSSLGVQKISIPSSIALPTTFGIEADAYGLQENKAYYIVKDNSLMAKNTGIPLVYGASNLTKLLPNIDMPSLIIPGLGFLSEAGQYKEYTLEAWVRINSDSITKKRIIGPIGSTDGLYVEGPFIILKVGNNSSSYYVGEWTRPMLIHIRFSENNSSLLINGEEVISLNYISSELDLPKKLNTSEKDQDWIGFYAYEDVSPIEIDCVAIYTYQVPIILAKKRFVYGQGVEFPEGINQAYSGSSVYIDYPFADYTNNYSYPNIGKWSQATIDNLSVENNLLCTPDYKLPEIILGSSSIDQLYSILGQIQDETDKFFSFGSNESGCMYFDNLNFLNQRVRSFYGSFKFLEEPTETQILFRIESENSSDYFEISTQNKDIIYKLAYGNTTEVLATFSWSDENPFNGIVLEEMFSAGLDIEKVSKYFGGNVASFFGNINTLKFYIGGKSDLTQTFTGKIYKVGFCTARNHKKIEYLFNERGIPINDENVFELYQETVDVEYNSTDNYFGSNPAEWDQIIDSGNVDSYPVEGFQVHTASYTLSPSTYFDEYTLDIDIQGYWEDYIPLTYFAQYVEDEKKSSYYDLDLIQFNINYPAPSNFVEEEQTGEWTYRELADEYNIPIQRTYQSLDNQLFTGYLNYDDLKNRAYKNYKYDTSNSLVKSYVTFQYVQNGANLPESNFANVERPSNDSIVVPGTNWINTKYEVVNNMIVYPPKDVNVLDLAMVTHLDFNVKGIIHNRVKVRNLEYASQAFNSTSPNPIGTRFGNEIFPYKKSGFYYDYKERNPFTIYKGSSPYLYLTRYTGIELKGTYDPTINRGLSIPINRDMSTNYKVMAMQTAIRYDQDAFPYAATEIFEIESKNTHIKFYMVAIHPSGERAKIYAVNVKTGRVEDGIGFYWNGKLVKEPVITVKEWGFLGISFPTLLDFTSRVGSINLNGPITFNTISYYQSTNLQEVQKVEVRPWFAVKYAIPLTLEWDYWKTSPSVWDGVLILSSTSYYGVDPSTIYKSYTGTNKIIIDTDKVFTVNGYEYTVYKGITSKQITADAV